MVAETPPIAARAITTLREAWTRLLDSPGSLPRGVLPFLMAASVDFPSEGQIRLSMTPGPGLEKMEDPPTLKAVRRALGKVYGSDPEIILAEGSGPEPGSGRITQTTVRNGRLQELVEKEPTLGEAVKELDLELLEKRPKQTVITSSKSSQAKPLPPAYRGLAPSRLPEMDARFMF